MQQQNAMSCRGAELAGRTGNLLFAGGSSILSAGSRFGMTKKSSCVVSPSVILVVLFFLPACTHRPRIVVGCKNFTEQIILGELIAQQIENKTHLPVERRFYLGGTYIAHQSILAGRIDIYPE